MDEMLAVESEAERSRPPGPRVSPWFVFPYGKCGKDQAFYNLCDPNRTYLRSIPEMSCKWYWQSPSHQGWLIIVSGDDSERDDSERDEANDQDSDPKCWDCFLWNPVSLETIQLPSLDIIDWDQYVIRHCLLSSPPSNPDDSMVFILYNEDDYDTTPDHLLFCNPGDKQWRTLELSIEKDSAGQVICFKGRVYYMYPNNEQLMIKELVRDDQSLSIKTFNVNFEIPPPPPLIGPGFNYRTYYVESFDELFIVEKHYYSKELVTLQILRMNFSLMTLEEVKSLGDHVLFLGLSTIASCSAADLGYTNGCVYFMESYDKSLYTFDLEDASISVTLPCPNLPTPWITPEWVIMPMTVRVPDGRRSEHLQKRRRMENVIIETEENKTSINDNEKEGKKNNEEELEQAGTCCILNAGCKACRSAIPAVKWKTASIKITQTTSLSPWLVFLKKDDAIYNFVDPVRSEKYIVNLSEFLLGAKIHFSKGGWLLMSKCYETFFFFNPFTRAMIKLPDLPDGWNFMFSAISFSSLPTSSDCSIFAITECVECCKHKVHIFFIARGDSFWKEYTFKNTRFSSEKKCMEFKLCLNNPVFYAEAFYCLDCNGSLGVFDLEDNFRWKILAKPKQPCRSIDRCFLVECEGKLLSVFLGHLGKWIRIFRLDFTRRVWVEVKCLGKHMLFVSHSSCISAVAPDSGMENKIYFPRFHGEGIVFYSLDTCRYHSVGSRHSALDFYNSREQIHCSWIQPNWSQPTDKELDWLRL
ncbi:Protein of unknown function DUF295 [Macleaya cordata]|uniref:KIB1-4 beta-propeller domain-containing protein n=1 Tax=Macleaya cordata TaxID=56857 RepID=A0A200Q0J7_MACCD|nr:Protein of unknown function DUF295 [Macleaya cordata]